MADERIPKLQIRLATDGFQIWSISPPVEGAVPTSQHMIEGGIANLDAALMRIREHTPVQMSLVVLTIEVIK